MAKKKDYNDQVGEAMAEALNDAFDAGRAYQRVIDAQSDFDFARKQGRKSHEALADLVIKPAKKDIN